MEPRLTGKRAFEPTGPGWNGSTHGDPHEGDRHRLGLWVGRRGNFAEAVPEDGVVSRLRCGIYIGSVVGTLETTAAVCCYRVDVLRASIGASALTHSVAVCSSK